MAIAQARREVELIGVGAVDILATALVQPVAPRLFRVQDPFATLLAKARGSVVVNYSDIARSATE